MEQTLVKPKEQPKKDTRPFILCRYDHSENYGDPKKYCGKDIEKGSLYCPEHKKRFPIWP